MPAPVMQVKDLEIETVRGDTISTAAFDLARGEVLALVGESGSGKTTIALGLLAHSRPGTRVASGSVAVGGQDMLQLKGEELRRARGTVVSYVPQDPSAALSPRHRLGAQLREELMVHGMADQESALLALLERVHLPSSKEFLDRYPFELSGGQQQRIIIAMAIACKADVIVLDEPTTGLDVTTQAHVLELIRELATSGQASFVHVTHDLAVVEEVADRVAVMYAGRVVELGARDAVLGTPLHPYTSLLLEAVPSIAAPRELSGIPGTMPTPGERAVGCPFAPRCPLAVARCTTEDPPLGDDLHAAACWRAGELRPSFKPVIARNEKSAAESILDASDLVASYGHGSSRVEVVHGVSFTVSSGECLALVGESGSGKTTLGRCISGLHLPDSGTIELDGMTISPGVRQRSPQEKHAIQVVYQNPQASLNPMHAIGRVIGRPLELAGEHDAKARRKKVFELLDRVRLAHQVIDVYPRELSGGQQQRVAIARALASNPRLLVCDEITSALDVSIQAAIVNVLEELRADGLSILFITHNLGVVASLADRVLVLQDGAVCEEGDVRQTINNPRHEYTKSLRAAAPELTRPMDRA